MSQLADILLIAPGAEIAWRGQDSAALQFNYPAEDVKLELSGIRCGDFGEELCIVTKARQHGFLDRPGGWGELESYLPFGREPRFRRRWTSFGRLCQFSTEIGFPAPFAASSMLVDQLILHGQWRRVDIVKAGLQGIEFEHLDIASNDNLPVKWTELPLAWIFESISGFRVEVGFGRDLWRWQSGGDICLPEFMLSRESGALRLDRTVVRLPDDGELPARNWRFTWYIAWSSSAKNSSARKETDPNVFIPPPGKKAEYPIGKTNAPSFSLNPPDWPAAALAMGAEGCAMPALCQSAPAVRRQMRHWLRSSAERFPGQSLSVSGWEPQVCHNAAHLERPKREILWHWDLPAMHEFWIWANRQLMPEGADFRVFQPGGRIIDDWPALSCMTGTPKQCPGEEE